MERLKCLYAILYSPDPRQHADLAEIEGLDGSAVYAVPYQDISAAVSDIGSHPLKLSNEVALNYESIIERIMEKYPLLPMRFGTLVKDEGEVGALLQKYYADFVNNLQHVQGTLEYGLKLLWDVEQVKSQIRTLYKTENGKGFGRVNEDSPHHQYLLKKFKEHHVEDALMKHAESIIAQIHPPLQELSVCSTFKKMITPKIILNAAYLVEREQQETFIHKVEELHEKERDVKFLLTGPWPPYNFTEISLRENECA